VSTAESKKLNDLDGPFVLIAGSGMMTGGRILHHIRQRGDDPKNLLCVTGYQAEGTRGRALVEGATTLRIHGRDVPIRAKRFRLTGLSGHADADELMRWRGTEASIPDATFVTHGEPKSAEALAERLRKGNSGWVHVAATNDRFELGALAPREN
jgi:metallo-beta-lactamase family protein